MKFSLLTYNIHKGIGNDGLYKLDRTIEIIKSTNADFILLQEVDRYAPRSKKEDTPQIIANELGMYYSVGMNVKLKKGEYGNATLSRFPIIDSNNINLKWGIKKTRGCLVTTIDTPATKIIIMNIHLGLAGFEREWQIKKIIQYISKKYENFPLILAGDSNDRNHKLDKILMKVGLMDSLQENSFYTFPSYAPIWRLDKIYINQLVSPGINSVIKNKLSKITSDHLPLKGEFTIN